MIQGGRRRAGPAAARCRMIRTQDFVFGSGRTLAWDHESYHHVYALIYIYIGIYMYMYRLCLRDHVLFEERGNQPNIEIPKPSPQSHSAFRCLSHSPWHSLWLSSVARVILARADFITVSTGDKGS